MFTQILFDSCFMVLIQERKQQGDGNGIRFERFQVCEQFLQIGCCQLLYYPALRIDPAADFQAQILRDRFVSRRHFQVIQGRAGLTANCQNIAKAFVGDKCSAYAFVFQRCIGGDGGTVNDRDLAGSHGIG